uniref:Uncharacterized protein n=1 Tax=Geladintestivirus 5 TaxID=3233137 RepID=A0AAU8MJU8_9CAUD
MKNMRQNNPMFTLGNDDASVLHLGQLRWFLNETCRSLPDNTPIMLNCIIGEDLVVPCIQVLADEESVEFYNF